MGEVYLAWDEQLQRPVALKVVPAEFRNDDELRARLEQEARAASALNHPNILTVYDVGTIGDAQFIATEFVEGITLRERLQRGEVPVAEVLQIVIQAASALDAANAAGLVHRDIKPENIMLRADGFVKLLDFGLARMIASKGARITQPGMVRGTIAYMSPEQFRGANVDHRSDLWSLGVVLYELVCGRIPFDGSNASDIAGRILHGEPAPMCRRSGAPVPAGLETIARCALTKDRELRYSSARDLHHELVQLHEELARHGSERATTEVLAVIPAPPSNLPQMLTPLLGRDEELESVVNLLKRDEIRLVTLTGAGGTGKTRLSVAVAGELRPAFNDGVWWVSLGPILDASLVLDEIATALGIHAGSVSLLEAVLGAIRERAMLLVLDNFEQVLDAAPIVARLLAAAPRSKAIISSRSPLRIRGEHEYPVPTLTLPPADHELRPEALDDYAATALFVERARAVRPDWRMTAADARAIAEICTHLDGLPLAIELAAARMRALTAQMILARAGDRFKLLSGGARDLPQRQQTMRAAIDWGYNLLDDDEKTLFETLSIFRGGFSLRAAERLAGNDVLEGISSLIDKAFLRCDQREQPRYAMLETIREYGLERLAERGRRASLQHAHAAVMASIAEENELETDLLGLDEDNFRNALETAIEAEDAEIALRLAAALWWHWYVRGIYREGRRWIGEALSIPEGEGIPIRAKALTGAGVLAFLQCDYEKSAMFLDSAIELARTLGDTMSLARALHYRGSIARERGEYERAIALHQQSRALWVELEDRANAGRSLNAIAFASWLNRDFESAFGLSQTTLRLFRERNDVEGVTWSLLNLAAAAFYSGDADQAQAHLDDCLAGAREHGYKEGIAWSLNLLGIVLRARDDKQAARLLRESLRMQRELGDRWRCTSVLEALAGVTLDPRLLGGASALRRELGTPVPAVERAQFDSDVAKLGVQECTIEEAIAIATSLS